MKWVLLLSVLLIVQQQFAESRKFTAKAYAFSDKDSIGTWNDCNIPIVWDTDNNLVRIYSEADQKIFYLKIAHFDYDSVKISAANSIDENNLRILFKYIEFDAGEKYIEIDYSDIRYVYELEELK